MFRPPDDPRLTAGARRLGLFLVVGALVTTGLGCSGDEEAATSTAPTTTTSSAPPSASASDAVDPQFAELCELALEVNEQDGPPTAAQLQEYSELAPELRPAVENLAAALAAAGDDMRAVFSNPEAAAALEQVTAFEATSCGLGSAQDASVNELDPDATRVDVTATDYHFDAEFPTEAGRYSLVVTNDGAEPHVAVLARLEEGVSVEEALASQGGEGIAEMFESDVAPPGAETVITAELKPGGWVFVCPIADAEGTPHLELVMAHDFTVE